MIRAYGGDDHHDGSRDSGGGYVVRPPKQGHRDGSDANQHRQSPDMEREKEEVEKTEREAK